MSRFLIKYFVLLEINTNYRTLFHLKMILYEYGLIYVNNTSSVALLTLLNKFKYNARNIY